MLNFQRRFLATSEIFDMDTNTDALGRRLIEAGYPPLSIKAGNGRVQSGVIRGREPANGYTRGVGLEFGQLARELREHPLYLEALEVSRRRSVVIESRLMNLFLLIAFYFDALQDHNVAEFGAYRGGSSLFMAHLLKRLYPQANMYAFDTFEGMPPVDSSADFHLKGDFSDSDFPGLVQARQQSKLDNLQLVKGLVQDTFPRQVPVGTRFGLAHFDMDIYEPTAYAQSVAWAMMTRGGYFVYDDATVSTCIGATQAVEDLTRSRGLHCEQIYPHFVFRVGL